jgi:hypothetical protein
MFLDNVQEDRKLWTQSTLYIFCECHLRFSQWCCRRFGPPDMLHCVRNIPGNSHPQQKSSSQIFHYGVNEPPENTLPHMPYGTPVFQRNASQNFITKLVMQSHVYCAFQENNPKMTNDPLPTPCVPIQHSLSSHPTHHDYWWHAGNQEPINMYFKKTETKKNSTAESLICVHKPKIQICIA